MTAADLNCDACAKPHLLDGRPDPYEYAACAEKHTVPPRSYWCIESTDAHHICSGNQTWSGEACECACHDATGLRLLEVRDA